MTERIFKNDLARLIAYVGDNVSNTPSYNHALGGEHAVLRFKKKYEIDCESQIDYYVDVDVILNDLIEWNNLKITFTGENKSDYVARIYIRVFMPGTCVANDYKYYNVDRTIQALEKLLTIVREPYWLESEEYGKGIGFKYDDERYFAFLYNYRKGTTFHQGHFQKVEKLKFKDELFI